MSDDRLQDAINYGDQAKLLLGHEPFMKGMADLRQELMQAWERSNSSEDRDRIWISVNLLGKLAHVLATTVNNGRIARDDLNLLIKERS